MYCTSAANSHMLRMRESSPCSSVGGGAWSGAAEGEGDVEASLACARVRLRVTIVRRGC